MRTGPKRLFVARCKQRGYALADVMGCVVKQDGDTWTVDETHVAYPRPKKQTTLPPAVLEQRKVACLSCQHFAHGKIFCKAHDKKPNGKRCESFAVKAFQQAIIAQKPWCEPWRHLLACNAANPTGDTSRATPAVRSEMVGSRNAASGTGSGPD